MFFTFGGTSVTDIGAKGAQLLGVAAAEAHQFRRRAANCGAFKVELNTVGKIFYI